MLKSRDLYLLELLYRNDGKPMRGFDLVEVSNGMISRGVVFIMLGRLEEQQLVFRHVERPIVGEHAAARHTFALTAQGQEVVRRERDQIPLRLTELDHRQCNLWGIVFGVLLGLIMAIMAGTIGR